MLFKPEFASVLEKLPKSEVLALHKSIKRYTKKVVKKQDLKQQLIYLIASYEIMYNKLNQKLNPECNPQAIDKSKLNTMSQNDLYGIHACMRNAMRYSNTKKQVIDSLIKFSKQMEYFVSY